MRRTATAILFKVAARFETSRSRLKRLLKQPGMRAPQASSPPTSEIARTGQRHIVE